MSTPRPFDAQLLRVKRAYDRVSGEMAKLALQSTTGLHETATGARVAIAEFRSEVAKLPPLAENAADLDRASKLDYARIVASWEKSLDNMDAMRSRATH